MSSPTPRSLEDFVERHRADFDIHEPRPDLWASLEKQLEPPTHAASSLPTSDYHAPVMAVAGTRNQQPATRNTFRTWFQRYGIAAGLAGLAFAAGVSEAWKSKSVANSAPNPIYAEQPRLAASDAALFLGTATEVLPATSQTGIAGDSQLTSAVRGMENYYVAQLQQREAQLRRLGDTSAVPGRLTDWQEQLVSLDSSYRLLKRQLLRHPHPETLLTALNRNLQIRLDILDQQLYLTAAPDATATAGAFMLADHRQP